MSEKDKKDKKDRIEEKTIIEKTEIISNTDFEANQIDTLSLLNITKFKEYQILKQLEIFSNFSDLFLTKKEDKYYILKLYRMGIKLDDLVLSRIKSINSELIVNIIDYGFDNQLKRYYIVEEFYSLGSLNNFIKDNYDLIRNNYKVIDSIINQLNEGIYLLHKNEILHKDIKSSNILIKEIIRNEQGDIEDIRVVISDFNISSIIPTEASKKITEGVKGTIWYMAPESFSKVITKKSDYWSLGMILYELLFRNLPFENIDTNIVIYKILTEDIQINKEIPIKYQILLRGLFIRNPEKRFYYEEVKKVLNAKDAKQLEKIEEELLIPLFSQGLNKKAEFKVEKTEFNDKVIIYNNKQYKNIDELIKEVEKDTNIFYSIVKIIEDGSYKELFDKEDIKKIDYYLKKLNNVELAVSLFISEKNREFNLYGIRLNQNKLVEICKKYLDSNDLKELIAQELNIIKLIKNYYLKKIDDYNIFDVYEISKEKDIGLNKIFEIIKRIEIDTSKIDYIFPFIISLIEVDGFYKLIYERKYFNPQNIDKEISTIEFIIEKDQEILKYWAKVLGKEKLKNIVLYYFNQDFHVNQEIVKFLFSEVFNKEEIGNMLYELIRINKEEIIKFVLSKYQELAYIRDKDRRTLLHHAVINNSLSLVKFLISVYINYKSKSYINLKDKFYYTALDYAIERNYNEIAQVLTRYGASSSDIFISANTINSSLESNWEQRETINSSLGSNCEQGEAIHSSLGSNRKHREAVVGASIFGILTFLLGLFLVLPYADNPMSGLLEVILLSFFSFGAGYILVLAVCALVSSFR
jgi:serine/threonine protein kinase